jgi:hypothetical protein
MGNVVLCQQLVSWCQWLFAGQLPFQKPDFPLLYKFLGSKSGKQQFGFPTILKFASNYCLRVIDSSNIFSNHIPNSKYWDSKTIAVRFLKKNLYYLVTSLTRVNYSY